MRSWLTYIFLLMVACGTVLTSCSDVLSEEGLGTCDDRTTVRLTISFGGNNGTMSRDVDSKDEGLDYTTPEQAEINENDIYALVVDANDNFLYRIKDLKITANPTEGDNYYTRTLTGTMIQTNEKVRIVLLANLIQNKIKVNNTTALDSKKAVESYIDGFANGTAVSTIYNNLVYNYDGTTTPWTLTGDNARRIPMWGQSQETTVPPAQDVTLTCNLYRAVAKVQIWVNEKNGLPGEDGVMGTDDDFKITKITVQNANNQGYCVHVAENQPTTETQYTRPKVPTTVKTQNIVYNVVDEDSNGDKENDAREAYSDMIYLPEQFNTGDDATPVNLLVEYTYNGLEYKGNYAGVIEFKDAEGTAFDVVRNHSYIFNITKSLDFMFVKVEPWEDEYMRGVPDQYTLTTDRSVISYETYKDVSTQPLEIWTDYSDGWYIEGLDSNESSWLSISETMGVKDLKKQITINPTAENRGISRVANFYVVAGNIKKEITVIQPQPPTANCYVVGEGTYELIVSIKGNGNDGIMPENHDIVPGDGDASITPDKIGIIWETKAGLIKLIDGDNNTGNNRTLSYNENSTPLVDYNHTTNSIKYEVDITGATIGGASGGNALIGAFDANNKVIWSWHIWVSPDIIDPNTQTIKDACVEEWTLNDYDVLDRNLGALANRPIETQEDNTKSVASMGLLYQWGRKDPFIGAAYSNDNFTGDGVLPVVHYYDRWAIDNLNNSQVNAIEHTIANPTHLIHKTTTGSNSTSEGLASLVDNGGYLWGTDQGFVEGIIDQGSKTIYDPCPVGYRVPPVNAFVFAKKEVTTNWTRGETFDNITINRNSSRNYNFAVYYKRTNDNNWTLAQNGTISNNSNSSRTYDVAYATSSEVLNTIFTSEDTNWNENLIYIPHRATKTTDYGNIWYYTGNYVTNANYYGFWMNYKENSVPALASGTHTDGQIHYELANYNNLTWLPLTGAYDPTKGFAFKSNGQTIQVTQGSSLTVNSFLWTNSRITNDDGDKVPGAMFLHGTEVNSTINGRHIHYLNDTDITAEPHQAGAVRCVRDRAKTIWDINFLSGTARIGNAVGSTTTINIVSVNADWELIDPGMPWLQVTPDKGTADKGQGTTITLKMLEAGHSGETATLVFKIANEQETRSCVVTVQ